MQIYWFSPDFKTDGRVFSIFAGLITEGGSIINDEVKQVEGTGGQK